MAAPTGNTDAETILLEVTGPWESILQGEARAEFEAVLPQLLLKRRWFGGKGRPIHSATIQGSIPVSHDGARSFLVFIRVDYREGKSEVYVLALSYAEEGEDVRVPQQAASSVFVRVRSGNIEGVVYDAVQDRVFVSALLELLRSNASISGITGRIEAVRTASFTAICGSQPNTLEPHVMGAEQSNSSIVFGEQLILKLFRRLEEGINPDFEIGQFLTEHGYLHSPQVAGALELHSTQSEPSTVALLQGFVKNQGDAWKYTLERLQKTLQEVAQSKGALDGLLCPGEVPSPPEALVMVAGDYLDSVRLLAQRTSELHLTLASDHNEPNFAPETVSAHYQQSVFREMCTVATTVLSLLQDQLSKMGPAEQDVTRRVLAKRDDLLELFKPVTDPGLNAQRIRIHGDYHLGQVLFTGDDFIIIDFEGEPMRSLRERRIKRSPLRDVAGMIRSFDYAGQSALLRFPASEPEVSESLRRFTDAWVAWVSAIFVDRYLEVCDQSPFLPSHREKTIALLAAFCLDKAVYEVGYEINNRPAWVRIPLNGIARILDQYLPKDERQVA
ncbi:MAG: putative maltokinase [Acidobacteriales bacterium]|nr:putative maltokinase [Terriglobales bacterium]